jgi:hypothetical protein
MSTARLSPGWVEEYWSWIAVALFLLLTVDTLTTLYAAAVVGPGGEANPIVRWALQAGPLAVAGLNLVAALLTVLFFYGLLETVRRTPERHRRAYVLVLEGFVGTLVAAGLVVFANNLSVVVLGRSLL